MCDPVIPSQVCARTRKRARADTRAAASGAADLDPRARARYSRVRAGCSAPSRLTRR